MLRLGVMLAILLLALAPALADDSKYIMNFDLNSKLPDGSGGFSIQLQGVHLRPGNPFHGNDLGKYAYFLTVSGVEDGKGRLTIEFYEYESRRKVSEVISEIISEVGFELGTPAVFEGKSDTFSVDLAFSIDQADE